MNEPKKLYRAERGTMLCGVCAGVAEYFNLDPSVVRLGTVILAFAGGTGLWVYIAAAVILPRKSDVYPGC